jgi:anti-sigma factor RsiW
MNCTTVLDVILEAERGDLEGLSESELSRHLRRCATCRAAAARILDAERRLGDVLGTVAPQRDAAETVRVAAHVAAARAVRRRWLWRGLPLAAAATVAALFLGRRPPPPGAPPLPPLPSASLVEVQGPPGQGVAVFTTDNPDVVVIWFF